MVKERYFEISSGPHKINCSVCKMRTVIGQRKWAKVWQFCKILMRDMQVQTFLCIWPKFRQFPTSEPLEFNFRKIIFYSSINSLRHASDNLKIKWHGSHLLGILIYCQDLTKNFFWCAKCRQ